MLQVGDLRVDPGAHQVLRGETGTELSAREFEILHRLPPRTRLVAGFAAAMLVVLVAGGGFVYWRVESALDRELCRDGNSPRPTSAQVGGCFAGGAEGI